LADEASAVHTQDFTNRGALLPNLLQQIPTAVLDDVEHLLEPIVAP